MTGQSKGGIVQTEHLYERGNLTAVAKTNDEKAWFCDQVIENRLALFRLAKSILQDDSDAEDAVQDAVLAAYSKLSTLRDRNKFKPWIMKIVLNSAYQIYGKRKSEVCLVDEDIIPAPVPHDSTESISLWSAIETLSDDLRTVVVLFYYEDMSISEISRITGATWCDQNTSLPCKAKAQTPFTWERSTQ